MKKLYYINLRKEIFEGSITEIKQVLVDLCIVKKVKIDDVIEWNYVIWGAGYCATCEDSEHVPSCAELVTIDELKRAKQLSLKLISKNNKAWSFLDYIQDTANYPVLHNKIVELRNAI